MTEYSRIAKLIDHAVLHPTATDDHVRAGAELSARLNIAAFCVHSKSVSIAQKILGHSDVALAAVVGFPHGNIASAIKQAETERALSEGAAEIDMVIDIGAACAGEWDRIDADILAVNRIVAQRTGILKVIFETAYLDDAQIIKLCEICTVRQVGYVKTSTGFASAGAATEHIALMKHHSGPGMGIKASGGIRSLADLEAMVAAGATRIGTSSTEAILDAVQEKEE